MEPLDVASLLAEPAPLCWDRLTATNGPLDEAGPDQAAAASEDPLTLALPWLVRHLGVADALAATLDEGADGEPVGADQVLPALRRIGFDARLVRCPIEQLRHVRLPAVLLLRCGDACVLTGSRVLRGGEHLLQLVMPGQPPLSFEVPAAEVAREYTGVALLVRPLAERPLAAATERSAGEAAATPGPRPSPLDRTQAPLSRLALALEEARQAALRPPPAPATWPALAGAQRWLRSRLRQADGAWRQWLVQLSAARRGPRPQPRH